jgi:branched-chain amino acid transport system ATP-binding protein
MSPILDIKGLHAGYGMVPVLRDIELHASEGEIIAVVGTNGAGKTTLMSAIAGLIRPTAGTIRFNGDDITGLAAHRVTERGLALVPEGGRLFPFMTVLDNLELGGYAPRARAETHKRLDAVMTMFPILDERRHQLAGKLSGGERQMCAIARAVMSNPKVLLLDEPSVGLSPLMAERVFDIVGQLATSQGLTIVIVEQKVSEALELAKRAYILDQGRIIRSGLAAELSADQQIQATYMGL